MVRLRKVIALGGIAALALAFAGCSSPLLNRIKEKVVDIQVKQAADAAAAAAAAAKAPFAATSYTFVRQWGNPAPQYTFADVPLVKADTAGFIYLTDSSARIRKYAASTGAIQSTISIYSTQGFSSSVTDMAFDVSGNMYAITSNAKQLQKYSVSGNLLFDWGGTTAYGVNTSPAALSSPGGIGGIAVDGSGGVYVVDSYNKRILKFDSAGNFVVDWGGSTTYGNGTTIPVAAMSNPQGIAIDSNGYVYVMDRGNNRVLVFYPVTTTAPSIYNYWGGTTTFNGFAFNQPSHLSLSPGTTQYVYVVDGGGTNNSRVLKFTTYGIYVAAFGSVGTANGAFTSASGVAVDTSGYIYVSDGSYSNLGYRVQKFDLTIPSPYWVATWGGPPGAGNGILVQPWGIAQDASGNTYVAETFNDRIQKFDPAGNYLLQAGSTGSGAGQLNQPVGIAIDASGNILVADESNNRIQVFNAAGAFQKTIGAGQLSGPIAIVLDSAGDIFVNEASAGDIKVFDANGYYLRTIGSAGTGDGQFGYIYGLAIDKDGNLFVSDLFQSRVQKFDASGNFVTKWGTQGTGLSQFLYPIGVACDSIGNVYVCDMLNRRIQKFDGNGTYMASIGGVGIGGGSFAWPIGIAINPAGHLFVSDYMNFLVQELAPVY